MDANELVRKLRETKGEVPLGLISYNAESGEFSLYIFENQSPEEVDAMLQQIGLRWNVST
jgi:hypothetical protein